MRISDWSSDVCSSDLRDLITHARAFTAVEAIPFVDGEHHRAATLRDQTHQLGVLLADIALRIDDRDDHVRALDRRQRLDDRELFDGFPDARLATEDRKSTRLNSSH